MFFKKEIFITRDMAKCSFVKSELAKNGIEYTVKTNSMTNPGRNHGTFFIKAECAYEYRVFVKSKDYEKAKICLKGI